MNHFARHTLDEAALVHCAERLGRLLQHGDVVLLEGPMGAGKTTFCRALARGLHVYHPDRVCSPTFNICVIHDGPVPLAHIDLFRMGGLGGDGPTGAAAFEALGLPELADGGGGPGAPEGGAEGGAVIVVEWADLWSDPPPFHVRVVIDRPVGAAGPRHMEAVGFGDRSVGLVRAWNEAC